MRFKLLVWIPVFGFCAGVVHAQAFVEMSTAEGENISYAYADVLRAIPTYELVQVGGAVDECGADEADSSQRAESGRVFTINASSLNSRECHLTEDAQEERRINGYEVEYRYKGQVYMSHMGYDPGNKLRIRITIAPAD